jgi:hypothetical protein
MVGERRRLRMSAHAFLVGAYLALVGFAVWYAYDVFVHVSAAIG